MELRFAKPASANFASITDFGSRSSTTSLKEVKPTNSLMIVFSAMKLPTCMASCHGTPIAQASGPNTIPKVPSSDQLSWPNQPPMPPIIAESIAMMAMSRQPMVTAILPLDIAPLPTASMMFFDSVSRTSFTVASTSDFLVSGISPLATSREPGAFMMDAASRNSNGAPSSA